MPSSNPTPSSSNRETVLACGIIFFALAVLCFLLGWAEGVHHGRAYLRLPATGVWLVATAILGGLGAICLVWSRATKRG